MDLVDERFSLAEDSYFVMGVQKKCFLFLWKFLKSQKGYLL